MKPFGDDLKPSLAAVLMFVGAKMVIVDFVQIPPAASLAAVRVILGVRAGAPAWRSRSGAVAIAPHRAVERS